MGYKVNYRGLEVVVDSIDELDALADRQTKAASNGHSARAVTTPAANSTVAEFVASLKDSPKKALRELVSHGGAMADTALCHALGIQNNLQLGGRVVAPIIRQANRIGFDGTTILKKEVQIDDEGKWTQYIIPAEVIAEVKEGLKM